eukprot:SAG11_NODE_14570_length_607_cov_1.161417_1_plen_69_part_10
MMRMVSDLTGEPGAEPEGREPEGGDGVADLGGFAELIGLSESELAAAHEDDLRELFREHRVPLKAKIRI